MGGGNDTSKNLITFTIGGVEYQAEEGMTWEEWVNSEYNSTKKFYINILSVYTNHDLFLTMLKVGYDYGHSVYITEVIANNYNYTLHEESGGGNSLNKYI